MRSVSLFLRRAVTDLSIPKKLILIVGLFCIIDVGLLTLSYFGMEMLSGSRAYVGGESLWSKGQKEAVLQIGRYAASHDERAYQTYLKNIEVPLGDHTARLELNKPHLDYNAAASGFLRGGNHPNDIASLIYTYRWFRRVSYISRAIAFWTGGDVYIEDLQKTAEQIHREMISGHPYLVHLQKLLKHVQEIDEGVTPLENAFSATLGEGARWLKGLLNILMLSATGVFLAAALIIVYLISSNLCQEIDHLREGASRMASGDYRFTLNVQRGDEIGDLSKSFQEMANQRQRVEKLKDEFYESVVTANKELEAFCYSVSHDLRAPLRAIDGFSKELANNCNAVLDARSKADLARIRAATQRMGELIDDLLELSHLSRSELKLETVDLSAQVQEIAQRYASAEPLRTIQYVTAPHLTAQADPRLLKIALENLIQNALKFTRTQSQTRIEFGLARQNGHPTYFVRDNGVGFNMGYADKLFKPFQRLHESKEFPGTGIGLALVQRIIHRHGGKVWAEAEENKGATFFFTIS
jgi:signal transduction histidine kinase